MKLIVGLGNPGGNYQGTRHNVGFNVLAALAKAHQAQATRGRFQGETSEATIRGQKSLLLWPLTYMNLSGASVLATRDFYKIEHTDILIVCDDFNLPLAKLRFRPAGTAGGQKGLDDVISRLGTNEIPRLRIGIGQPPPGRDVSGYVLSRFTKEEQTEMTAAVDRAAQAAGDWVEHGMAHCMNVYNA